MLHVENLSLTYQGHTLFQDVSFALQKGERCGLVGRNGSGKTTLFKLLVEEEIPDKGTLFRPKGYRIGFLRQHIHFTKPTLIEEAALGLPEGEKDSLYKAEKILFGLGFIKDDLDRSPDQFSGGYHLRLHLAKILISEPDCLLLDEPTNYLDILSIRFLKRFLMQWKGELILISHDREFMDSVSTHTMGIHRQKIKKIEGGTSELFDQIALEEEVFEKERIKSEKKREHLEAFVERFGAKASKASQAQSRKKMIDRLPALEKLKNLYNLNFRFREAPFFSEKMLDAQNLSFSFSQNPLIHDLSLSIRKGERVAVIGKNGSGKSTFLRLLAKELAPQKGDVWASGNLTIGYFGQTHIERLNPLLSVEEEISLSNPLLTYSEVKNISGVMMFSGALSEKKISLLSGGEKSRVLLGKILAFPCSLLLLDEPTHHLDIESIEALIDALEAFQGALVLITHSELLLERIAFSKLVVFHEKGQYPFLGGYESFLEKGGWEEEKEEDKQPLEKESYKSQRRKQAELVQARSRALKPIEQAISRAEGRLTLLEKEQQQAHEKIISASQEANTSLIQTLGKEISARKTQIDALYDELEKLLTEKDLYFSGD